MSSQSKSIRYNRQIRAPKVRVIGQTGEQLGVMDTDEALRLAQDSDLDLVEVAGNVDPPVCKILDHGKYVYDLLKKEKDNKKKTKTVDLKEMKFRSKIEEHDYQTKLRHCEKFLKRGDKVKIRMIFRGRERAHIDIGQQVLARLYDDLSEIGFVERDFGLTGNNIVSIISPKN